MVVRTLRARRVRRPLALILCGGALLVAASLEGQTALPPDVSAKHQPLIGEYGPESRSTSVLERAGTLYLRWRDSVEFRLVAAGNDSFRLRSEDGMQHGLARVVRGRSNRIRAIVVAGTSLPQRIATGRIDAVFRIRPQAPIGELRMRALAVSPPDETGEFRPADLVELVALDSTIATDIRYASTRNFLSTPVYSQPRAFMQRPAAEALVRVHRALESAGYGLLIHDGYRPWYVTRMFWDATPDAKREFVANPASGSKHNRGCAVDLTLYSRATGQPVVMPGGYDEMSSRSYPTYTGGTTRQRALRDMLRSAMEREGFSVDGSEWWHFDYKDWRLYRIGNQRFEELGR
jgi:D-alanyl-D-alanine dipeptidase